MGMEANYKLNYSLNVFAKAVHLFSLVLPVRNKSEIKKI